MPIAVFDVATTYAEARITSSSPLKFGWPFARPIGFWEESKSSSSFPAGGGFMIQWQWRNLRKRHRRRANNEQAKETNMDTRYYLVRVFYGALILHARFFIPIIASPVANDHIRNVPNRFLNDATRINCFQKNSSYGGDALCIRNNCDILQ